MGFDKGREKMIYNTPIQPVQVRLELSSYCNAHCRPCHGHGDNPMTREKGHMDMELVEKCLEDIQKFPEPLVEFVGSNYGEMFIRKDWDQIMSLVAKKLPPTRIVVPTNGTLIADGVVLDLCRISTLSLVNFSVNAALPETYESFHKLPASYMETIKKAAVKIRQFRPDVAIWISMVRDSQYQSPKEVELFKEEWSKYGVVQINQCEFNNKPERAPDPPVKLPCRSIWSDLVVNWDGRVTSCCYDGDCNLVVGDANKQSLINIWHSKEFSELRKKHNAGKRTEIPICRACTFA